MYGELCAEILFFDWVVVRFSRRMHEQSSSLALQEPLLRATVFIFSPENISISVLVRMNDERSTSTGGHALSERPSGFGMFIKSLFVPYYCLDLVSVESGNNVRNYNDSNHSLLGMNPLCFIQAIRKAILLW